MADNDDVLDLWRIDESGLQLHPRFKIAIIISVLIGIAVTSYLIIKMDEPYSGFYLVPESINYSNTDNMVSFTLGILSHEKGATNYHVDIYAGNILERTIQYEINRDESAQYQEKIPLPMNISFPLKISLQLSSDRGGSQETHFWLKNSSFK
jgi:hypothetical protein